MFGIGIGRWLESEFVICLCSWIEGYVGDCVDGLRGMSVIVTCLSLFVFYFHRGFCCDLGELRGNCAILRRPWGEDRVGLFSGALS
jgi:hypothetical protein